MVMVWSVEIVGRTVSRRTRAILFIVIIRGLIIRSRAGLSASIRIVVVVFIILVAILIAVVNAVLFFIIIVTEIRTSYGPTQTQTLLVDGLSPIVFNDMATSAAPSSMRVMKAEVTSFWGSRADVGHLANTLTATVVMTTFQVLLHFVLSGKKMCLGRSSQVPAFHTKPELLRIDDLFVPKEVLG
jgi:hypothetical protein